MRIRGCQQPRFLLLFAPKNWVKKKNKNKTWPQFMGSVELYFGCDPKEGVHK